jgi:hypothetical protein
MKALWLNNDISQPKSNVVMAWRRQRNLAKMAARNSINGVIS